MRRKKQDTTYQVALFGAKGIVRLLVYILILIIIIWIGRTAYVFGYSIFNEQAVAASPGKDVSVTIPEDASPSAIGSILKKNGLISDVNVFVVQERLSGYHGKIKAGTYTLNTSETTSEMLVILDGDSTAESGSSTTDSAGNMAGNSAKGTNSTGASSQKTASSGSTS